MTEVEREAVRTKVRADKQKLIDGLAPDYLGRFCPFTRDECKGPECMLFLPMGDGSKITGGACCIPQAAAQAGPIAAGMFELASRVGNNGPSIIVPKGQR